MKKSLKAFQLFSVAVLLSLFVIQSNAQAVEWRLMNPTYNITDPDGAGPAKGSVTFVFQIHKKDAGTITNINAISTGWSYQSANAMIPTTPGCTTGSNPANVTVSSAFTTAGFTYTTVNQCGTFTQTVGGQTFDKRVVGTLDGTAISLTTTWTDVFTVTLWSLVAANNNAGFAIINHGSGFATISTGQFSSYAVSDDQANEYSAGSLSYAAPLSLATGAMPVTLSKFDITCNSNGAKLNWQTLTEQNSSSFDIEKSNNGATGWVTIGSSQAAGNSNSVKNYEFIDLTGGSAFYRLRQVDKDGKFAYSSVLRTNCQVKQSELLVYPVPARDVLNVVIRSGKNDKAEITLIDVTGKVIRQLSTELQTGSNNIKLNVAGLAAGEYFIKITGSDISKTNKITIIN